MSNSMDPDETAHEPSHLDLCSLQKPIITDCGSERVKMDFIVIVKRKLAFEHTKNTQIQIILRMHRVLPGLLLAIDTFYNILWFWQRTTKAPIRFRGCGGWSGPWLSAYTRRHVFTRRGLYLYLLTCCSGSHKKFLFRFLGVVFRVTAQNAL